MGKTIEEIENIRKEKREELDLRVNANSSTKEKHILVCHGTGCTSSKSPEILENFRRIIKEMEKLRISIVQDRDRANIRPGLQWMLHVRRLILN